MKNKFLSFFYFLIILIIFLPQKLYAVSSVASWSGPDVLQVHYTDATELFFRGDFMLTGCGSSAWDISGGIVGGGDWDYFGWSLVSGGEEFGPGDAFWTRVVFSETPLVADDATFDMHWVAFGYYEDISTSIPQQSPVPEPSTLVLALFGLSCLFCVKFLHQ